MRKSRGFLFHNINSKYTFNTYFKIYFQYIFQNILSNHPEIPSCHLLQLRLQFIRRIVGKHIHGWRRFGEEIFYHLLIHLH